MSFDDRGKFKEANKRVYRGGMKALVLIIEKRCLIMVGSCVLFLKFQSCSYHFHESHLTTRFNTTRIKSDTVVDAKPWCTTAHKIMLRIYLCCEISAEIVAGVCEMT